MLLRWKCACAGHRGFDCTRTRRWHDVGDALLGWRCCGSRLGRLRVRRLSDLGLARAGARVSAATGPLGCGSERVATPSPGDVASPRGSLVVPGLSVGVRLFPMSPAMSRSLRRMSLVLSGAFGALTSRLTRAVPIVVWAIVIVDARVASPTPGRDARSCSFDPMRTRAHRSLAPWWYCQLPSCQRSRPSSLRR